MRLRTALLGLIALASTSAVASAFDLKIVQPPKGSTVTHDVNIVIAMSAPVRWCNVYVDGHLLASSPAGRHSFDTTWTLSGVRAGKHLISARGYNAKNRRLATQTRSVRVIFVPTPSPTTSAPSATPTPTATPTGIPTSSPVPTPTPGPGTTFYIAPDGDDSNSGLLRSFPWKTVQHAAQQLQAGDTAIVTSGNYSERVKVFRSGNPDAPITFAADVAGTAVIQGFDIEASFVQILGFEITNQAKIDPSGYGVFVIGANNTIDRNYIHDLYFEGIMVSGNGNPDSSATAFNTISNNRIVRAEMAGIHVEGHSNLVVGNDVSWTRQYPVGGPVRDGADADGIRFFGAGNVFRSNNVHDIPYGTAENPNPHIDCFQTWGPATNISIERNFCVWPSASEMIDNEAASIEGSTGGIVFKNNVFANMRQGINATNSSGPAILNNTWDNVVEEAILLNSSPGSVIVNNIFYEVGSGTDSYACIDAASLSGTWIATNDHFMSQGSPGTYCSKAPYISRDPSFVDADSLNFHLTQNSPLVDAGTALPSVIDDYDGIGRPQGPDYDIGAFEFH